MDEIFELVDVTGEDTSLGLWPTQTAAEAYVTRFYEENRRPPYHSYNEGEDTIRLEIRVRELGPGDPDEAETTWIGSWDKMTSESFGNIGWRNTGATLL